MAKSANPNRTATPSTQGSRPGSAPPKNSSTIVAIGSSAGGLKALQSLFEGPTTSAPCFVVISHLAPNHPSELVSILSRCTKMPVCQVQQRLPLEANHVYVIAPDRQLSVSDSHIATLPPTSRAVSESPSTFSSDPLLNSTATASRSCVGRRL